MLAYTRTRARLRPESAPACPQQGAHPRAALGVLGPPESEQSPSELVGEGGVSREDRARLREDGQFAWPGSSDRLQPAAEEPQLMDP